MSKKIFSIITILCFCIVTEALAGPFGLEMGMSIKDIKGDFKELENGLYELSTVPKPHSSFDIYVVKIAPKCGLCWIRAIGKTIHTNSFGTSLISKFDDMEEKISSIYGEHKRGDFLMSGSIWDEPNDWMMSLAKKERILVGLWEREYGSSLPADLESVGLFSKALSKSKGFLILEYSFKNKAACDTELEAQENEAL